jgi:membrane protease YdiL (CAAX protease family)
MSTRMLWATPFLIVTLVAFPLLAILNSRTSQEAPIESVDRTALYVQLLVVQAVLGCLAVLAVSGAGLTVTWSARAQPDTIAVSVGLLVLAVLCAVWFRAPRKSGPEISDLLAPGTPRDWSLWAAGMLAAASIEEFAYRGTLFALATPFFESAAVPAALTAVVFGLTHAAQGWRGVVLSGLFGLGLQWLVVWSGGLLLAIAVHLTYDIGIQFAARRIVRRCP